VGKCQGKKEEEVGYEIGVMPKENSNIPCLEKEKKETENE